MGVRQAIPFLDFSGGDRGRERPLNAAVTQYRGSYNVQQDLSTYRGINTWRYPNGSIGPRPPWIAAGITGLPTGKTLRCFQSSVHTSGSWFAWAFSDGTIYSTTSASAVAALRGTTVNDPTDSLTIATDIYFVSTAGGGGGRVDNSGVYTAITFPSGGADLLVQHGGQTLALRQSDARLYWSAPDDPTSWPAENVVRVGDTVPATGIYVQRDTVVITKIDGSVWMFTGTLGVNETLRRIDVGLLHPVAGHAKGAVAGNSVIYWTSGSKMTAYTGAQLKTIPRPDMPYTAGYASDPHTDNVGAVVGTAELNSFLVLGTMDNIITPTTRLPWFHSYSPEQGWNRHTFPVTAGYTIPSLHLSGLTSTDSAKAIRTTQHVNGAVYACRPSDAAGVTTLKHYVIVPRMETPYAVSLPYQWGTLNATVDGDTAVPVVATFQSAEWWAPDGEECIVRALLVNFSYDSDAAVVSALGSEVGHRFDIGVDAMQRQDGGVSSSTAIAFVPTSGVTSAVDAGTMRRGKIRFDFADQGVGGGFRWTLANWRGIQIHWVTAMVDVTGARL